MVMRWCCLSWNEMVRALTWRNSLSLFYHHHHKLFNNSLLHLPPTCFIQSILQSRSTGNCTRHHFFGLFDSVCRGIFPSSSDQIARSQFRTPQCLFHALFGIHGRCPWLAVEVQIGLAQRRQFATSLLLCRIDQYCGAHSHAIVVDATRPIYMVG